MQVAEETIKKARTGTHPIRVLIIEHSKPDVELCLHELGRAGYEVTADVADDFSVCVDKIRNVSYDVILADYNLTSFTGMDAFFELGRCGKETPFILVTGTIGEETAVDCIKLGVTDYVLKDRLARLPIAVRRALEAKALEEKQDRTAKQLWASDAQLGLVFAQLPAIVWTTDLNLRVRSLNGMGLPRLGWRADQVLGCTLQEIYVTDDREFPPIAAHRRALLGQSAKYEHTHGTRQFYVCVEPLRDPQGMITGCLSLALDVTEGKKAEEALRESEARAQAILADLDQVYRTAPAGLCCLDAQFRYVRVNERLAAINGLSVAAHLGRTIFEVVPEIGEKLAALLRQITETGEAILNHEFEGTIPAQPGVELAWLCSFYPLKDKTGTVTGINIVVQEITELKRAERNIREINQRLAALVQSAPVAIVALDIRGFVLLWNPAAERIFGWSAAEAVGKAHPTIPADRETEFRSLLEVIQQGGSFAGVEARRRRKDGSLFDVSISAAPLRNAAGEVTGVMSVIEDITERKRAEAERQRLSTAVEQSVETVVITDRTGHIRYVNPAFTATTGYSREEAIGKTPRLLKSGRHDRDCYEHVWKTILAGEIWRGEITNRRKDGSLYTAEMSITPVRNEAGEIIEFIAIQNDITEKRALERQLAQAQKHDAIGQLAGGIAHDFNNVLAAIMGMAELGLMEVPQGSKIGERLEKIRHHGGRAVALTKQLLAFARRQALERRDINLNHAVAEIISLLGETLGKDIELRTKLGHDLWVTRADPGQVEQILLNLCLNARDAMPQGGQLFIETDNTTMDEEYCRLHTSARPGPYVRMTVSDTGAGMDAKTVERIFEPFFTTKSCGKGTGLGLATVFGIVKQHDGFIHVYSEPGEGATFRIYFPVSAPVPAEKAAAPPQAAVRGGRETILVADDHEGLRDLLGESLQALGYRVLTAADGEEAMEQFAAHQNEIDLVVLDVIMPKLRGPDVYSKMSAQRPGLPVIFCTGYNAETSIVNAAGKNGATVLHKPYTTKYLAQQVRRALDNAHHT